MSILQWFGTSTNQGTNQSANSALALTKNYVEMIDKEDIELKSRGWKRKSSERHVYEESVRTAIGKHAIVHGNKSAVNKFSKVLRFDVPECTVRNFKREAQKQISGGIDIQEVRIESKKQGRPLLLTEEIDDLTKQFIKSLRLCGSPVSSSIVLAAAKGIVIYKNKSMLKEFGGSVELTKSWAFSFLRRCGYVKRKSTCTARKIPDDFDEIKAAYLDRISEVVQG